MPASDSGSSLRQSADVRLRMLNEATGNTRQMRAHTVARRRKHVSRSVTAHAQFVLGRQLRLPRRLIKTVHTVEIKLKRN